jgi:hypothetical protein
MVCAGAILMKVPSEHVEQRNFVSQWRRGRPERILAIPNGESRSRSVGARLKLEGVSPGVPDLCVPELLLWIEMKRQQGGSVSKVQHDWINYLRAVGHICIVAKGCEDAWRQLAATGIKAVP